MICKEIREQLYEYIFRELDEVRCQEIKEHINHCENCNSEYNDLKQLLIEDTNPLLNIRDNIEIPKELNRKINSVIRTKSRIRVIRYLLAACLTIIILYTIPVFAYYASQVFPIDKYIHFLDKSMIKDFKEGRGQAIGKSCEMNGVKFTVDGMIKSGDKYNILFTIKVKPQAKYNFGMPADMFGVISVTDQFGKKYRVGGSAGSTETALMNGEFQYIFEIDEPLSFWSYNLKVRITAITLVYTNEKENKLFVKYKNVYGNWQVDFNVNRSLDRG